MSAARPVKRSVPAALTEATPDAAGQWILASPLLGFLAWAWVDLFVHYSPIAWRWLDVALGLLLLGVAVVLPLGWLAHRAITSAPRLFQNAGWDVAPLEPVREAEQYMVRYVAATTQRAPHSWRREWLRAAQGWVYLEIVAIFVGAVLLIPLFLSVTDFGFGR